MWSNCQISWLQSQRSRVRFPALPDFQSSSGYGTRYGSSPPSCLRPSGAVSPLARYGSSPWVCLRPSGAVSPLARYGTSPPACFSIHRVPLLLWRAMGVPFLGVSPSIGCLFSYGALWDFPTCVCLRPSCAVSPLARYGISPPACVSVHRVPLLLWRAVCGAAAALRPQLNILQLVLTGCLLSRNQIQHRPTIIGNRAVSREPQLPINVITMLTAAYKRHSRPVCSAKCLPVEASHISRDQVDSLRQ
jgi:hypothetical protein